MTSMFRRGTIFATFFLSLLGGGLVCAALVTQHWIEARPWRTPNPQESAGRVHFGLLQGKKELNVAYGWRTYHVSGNLSLHLFSCASIAAQTPSPSTPLWGITMLIVTLHVIPRLVFFFFAISLDAVTLAHNGNYTSSVFRLSNGR